MERTGTRAAANVALVQECVAGPNFAAFVRREGKVKQDDEGSRPKQKQRQSNFETDGQTRQRARKYS